MAQKMELKKADAIIHKSSLVYLAVCLTGVLIILIFGVIPNYMSGKELDRRAIALKIKIQENDDLKPVQKAIITSLAENVKRELPDPEKKPLPRSKSSEIFSSISEKAKRAGMTRVTVTPDETILAGDSEFLPVEVSVAGNFVLFREFLIGVASLPFLDEIEGIEIGDGGNGRVYKLNLRLALAK
jgi:Tfp pilus assembly protein PilO